MTRDGGGDDGVSSCDVGSMTRALLSPREKSEVVAEIVAAASDEPVDPGAVWRLGYGEDPDEPPPVQAYENRLPEDASARATPPPSRASSASSGCRSSASPRAARA